MEKIKDRAENEKVGIPLVFKEHVHLVLLDYLFRKGLFSDLVFRGETALRLVYQGVRYSEDLDFVLTKKNAPRFDSLYSELQALPASFKKSIPFVKDARLKIQKETPSFKRYCLILQTDFLARNDRTNIEVVNIPSHKYKTVIIKHPDTNLSPAVTVETPEEILSDKLVAFSARDYIKGRDLWDIYFLMNTMKIPVDNEVVAMMKKKISDYGLNKKEFWASFGEKSKMLNKEGVSFLRGEMDKFLPASYRDAFAGRYSEICEEESRMFATLLKESEK